jgi:transposase InsO family protein
MHAAMFFDVSFKEYIAYYYQDRPHQGIGQHIPDRYDLPGSK